MSYIDDVAARIRSVARVAGRGREETAPGVGEPTVAQLLISELRSSGEVAVHVPMDGLHLPNRQLILMGCGAAKAPAHERRSSVVE